MNDKDRCFIMSRKYLTSKRSRTVIELQLGVKCKRWLTSGISCSTSEPKPAARMMSCQDSGLIGGASGPSWEGNKD